MGCGTRWRKRPYAIGAAAPAISAHPGSTAPSLLPPRLPARSSIRLQPRGAGGASPPSRGHHLPQVYLCLNGVQVLSALLYRGDCCRAVQIWESSPVHRGGKGGKVGESLAGVGWDGFGEEGRRNLSSLAVRDVRLPGRTWTRSYSG